MTLFDQNQHLVETLKLAHPPVGVSGSDAAAGLLPASPSACRYWRHAEQTAFVAGQADHLNCKVGAHVMGFSLDDNSRQALGELVQTMTGVAYIAMEEVPAIPRLPEHRAWRYEPLAVATISPELVLMWLDGRQTMLVQEAMGSAHWKSAKGLRTTGRPACGALALAFHNAEAVLSFGCAGMRSFTDIPDHLSLFVLPGELLEGLCTALRQVADANAAMQCAYDRMRAHIEGVST